ncbi:uncharacterized protein V6R79_001358 [Siganus canaliculatus]
MIRMFMWPLQCLKGSSSELTLACSNSNRHYLRAAHLRARMTSRRSGQFKHKDDVDLKAVTRSDRSVGRSSRYVMSSVTAEQ